jgi:hypothetical protein
VAKPAGLCDWTGKSVLVTWGAGFVGSHLVEHTISVSRCRI